MHVPTSRSRQIIQALPVHLCKKFCSAAENRSALGLPAAVSSSGLSPWLLLALGSNPWPPMCAHPLPLLSLVQCWGLGSLQAWGASLLLPSHSASLASAGVMST